HEDVRRERAVGTCTERTMFERGHESGKQLALAARPVGRSPHREIECVRVRAAEEIGPVVERLQDAEGLGLALLADLLENRGLCGRVPGVDDLEPHAIVFDWITREA